MIYIISLVMLMVCLISGAILTAAGPNVKAIVDKDFARKTYNTAKVTSLQYANICLRAKTVIPDLPKKPHNSNSVKKLDLGWTVQKDGANITIENSTIHVYNNDAGEELIDADVTQSRRGRDLF